MAKKQITLDSVIVQSKDQISCDLAGEAAILEMKKGVYYGLDTVGARIWNLIKEPRKVCDVWKALLEEYEVAPADCRRDLLSLLGNLFDAGLIQVEA